MYIDFYGLKELPFALTPDPRFIYFTPSHTEVMANLHYGIESGKGLIVVTGEVGTGKTTMLRWVMQRLDRTVMVAYIFNPKLTVTELLKSVCDEFRIPYQHQGPGTPTVKDYLVESAGLLCSRLLRLVVGYREVCAPTVWPPPLTYAECRDIGLESLPGAQFRRRLFFRYSLVWTKP